MTDEKAANIYHLDHSGVAVQTANHLLVFDYYNDTPADEERNIDNGVLTKEFLQAEDDILVFVSHSHADHFNPVIFDWERYNSNIQYILSNDVEVANGNNYYKLDKYRELNLDDIYIKTYGTTDQGGSYYVEVDGINIFHSGDLNWWHWKKFTPAERKVEEEEYKAELDKLQGKEIDIAFVPVDPRLEEHYYLAGKYFAETIEPDLLVPIHFRDNHYITTEFAEKINDLPVASAEIKSRGDKLVF